MAALFGKHAIFEQLAVHDLHRAHAVIDGGDDDGGHLGAIRIVDLVAVPHLHALQAAAVNVGVLDEVLGAGQQLDFGGFCFRLSSRG
jgi:hypothetical protein